ncbi:MAG: O-antigen polymerase family protein [Labilithrix sp.]|nr:O-antigen polymerase family protein [Labilithrix sp.]
MPPAPAETRATTVGKWLLAAVIPVSGLAIGSVPVEVLVFVASLASLSCGLLWLERDIPISKASRFVLLALGTLLAATLVQAIPLPAAVTALVAPENADIWSRALLPLHEAGPAFHPISVAPTATHVELLKGLFYGCVFLSALRVTSLENGERFLTRVVIGSSLAMALSALGHAAVSADKVFGVYQPQEIHAYAPGRYAPLLNTNHLAAYMNLGACVSLGALLARRSVPRAISGSAVVVLAAMSIWQGSRGAAGALVFGSLLVFGLTFFGTKRHDTSRTGTLVLAACGLAATTLVVLSYAEATSHFRDLDTMKGEVALRSLALVRASPWLGSGRGSFETVFAAIRPGMDYVTWTNPEDIVVQWVVEWGIPVAAAGFGLLFWAFRPQIVLRAVRPAVGAWAAVVVTFLHDLVDYHLEVPGIVALTCVCAALVVSGRPTSRDPSRTSPAGSARVAAFVLAGASLVAVVWVLPDAQHGLAATRRTLGAEAIDRAVPDAEFRNDVRASLLRYPAEPFVPLMGAVRAQAVDGASVVGWVGRALERSPRFGRAHLVLARSLVTRNPAQARLEYRLAYAYDTSLRDAVVKESLPLVHDSFSALEVVPEGPAGAELLDRLVAGIAPRLPSTAVMLDEELERRVPTSIEAARRRIEAEVLDATSDAPWCDGSPACLDRAAAAARELTQRDPAKCEGYVLVARVRAKRGDPAGAIDALEQDLEKVSDHMHCQQELIALGLATGQVRRADAMLDMIVRSGCGAAPECLELYGWAASMEEQRGHFLKAVRLHKRILDITPDREDLLERIGALGDKTGLLADGLEAYRTLAIRHPSDPRYPARMAELRARAHPAPTVPSPATSGSAEP